MKKYLFLSLLTGLLFSAQTLMAYNGHVDTPIYKNEQAAVSSAKTTMDQINSGDLEVAPYLAELICQNSLRSTQQATGFTVFPVSTDTNDAGETQYIGKVGYAITCE